MNVRCRRTATGFPARVAGVYAQDLKKFTSEATIFPFTLPVILGIGLAAESVVHQRGG